ncbi:Ig-like domain-containing protein [Novipirellula artificiosorum]|uniref:Dockerin type I repeat protein n=1 Tax=Novipirellula artificiosorum TaxID=2528016 RepID=A0A5C6E254_9BACT|nr:Ig-like domain-containing protein [Novipirellula artificiosorum]TWU42564.1 hypothetical protein Poly41_08610 [Novipirellula artificiosorum]
MCLKRSRSRAWTTSEWTATDDSATTDEDTAVVMNVIANDSDPDGDSLLVDSIGVAAHGTIANNADGTITYTPDANYHGSDSFTYTLADGNGGVDTGTVMVSVTPVNDAPVAVDDDYVVDQDMSLVVPASGVLANDSDVDADTLSAAIVGDPSHGDVWLGEDGSFTYTPEDGFYGQDSFTYRVQDSSLVSDTATVTIMVNRVNSVPVANDDSYDVDEDQPINVATPGVLGNDRDDDGDPITANIISGVSHGQLNLNQDGSFNYTPEANFAGTDSFSYVANDGFGNSDQAIVTLTVNSVNDVPTAESQSIVLPEDDSKPVTLQGSDLDGDTLTYTVTIGPTHGTLAGTAPALTYEPAANYSGLDSFTFTVSDGIAESAAATVSISVTSVNDAPILNQPIDDLDVTEDSADSVIDLTGMFSDIDASDLVTLSVQANSNSSLVTASLLDNVLTLDYQPDQNGTATVTIRGTDGSGAYAQDSFLVTVTAVNDAPVAVDDLANTPMDTPVVIDVLDNDTDVDGESLSIAIIGSTNGTAVVNENGTVSFTPSASFSGLASFTYTLNDGELDSNVATVTIDVTPIASGPKLAHGVVTGVGSSGWTTVVLSHTYDNMVVIATPNYDSSDAPGVTRIQNASGNQFDVRVDSAGGGSLSDVRVHYVVVEAGFYDEPGYKMEAVTFNSTRTDENNSWVGESRSYLQSYSQPVVLGQVMSYNDPDWSVFWASGSSRSAAPTSSALTVGKHVGEDSDNTRSDETLGYIVIETSTTGTAEIEGLRYVAALGGDSIRGVGDSPAYSYSYQAMPNSKTAVASQAAMDGGNGGWAVLYGNDPITPTGNTINFAIDEDQARDTERYHTTEQVAYFIIDPPVEELRASVTAMDASGDGRVTSMDALLVINHLNTNRSHDNPSHLDLSQDGAVTPLDALVTINHLNQRTRSAIQSRSPITPQAVDQWWAMDDEDDNEGSMDEALLDILIS